MQAEPPPTRGLFAARAARVSPAVSLDLVCRTRRRTVEHRERYRLGDLERLAETSEDRPDRLEVVGPIHVAEDTRDSYLIATSATPLQSGKPCLCRAFYNGRYWARTSDLRLVEAALSQLS